MPLEKIETAGQRSWAFWRIEEEEKDLADQVNQYEQIPLAITNPKKRLEWLAGRLLVKILLEYHHVKFQGITKDQYGKPYPAGNDFQLSLSHSYPYAAALIDPTESVGIDLEQPKSKLLKIAPRVLDPGELENAGSDIVKHCVFWCAKEALVKIYGKKDLVFAENLKISPFSLEKEGRISGRIIVHNIETTIPLWYSVEKNFVVVFNKRE
jgi:4'-phosphopantetheinyl transferase EntD